MSDIKVLSLGWGVQSFTLAAMVAVGELERITVAIHADTTHERQETYEFAKRMTPWLKEGGVPVVSVMDSLSAGEVWQGKMIPAYTRYEKNGEALRVCTQRWKIAPMRRWISQELDRLELKKTPGVVEQWIGISLDEAERMKPSDVKYISNRWPLIERRMRRNDCVSWLEKHGIEVPTKSACVFCPFHSKTAWYEMKSVGGEDWQKAVAVDETIRNTRPPYKLFVHTDRIPLCDIHSPQDDGQLNLFSEECYGVCGV